MLRIWFADLVMVMHLCFVGFVAGGYGAILVGYPLGWRWVRCRSFRWAHLGAIGVVAVEAVLGILCPLTLAENFLRGTWPPQSFVGRMVNWVLYPAIPAWVFTPLYLALLFLALGLWRWMPPLKKPLLKN